VEAEVSGGENPSLDPAHCANEHRLNSGCVLPEGIGNRESGHQVAAGAATCDKDD
jgi:hypothetical protein